MTNKEALHKHTVSNYQIEHNGIVYAIGLVSPPVALKKIHAYVRKWVLKEWQRTNLNNDTTASLLADGKPCASVYGYHKNRSVVSITL